MKVRDVFEGPLPHEAGDADASTNTLYLVMNWVEGPTLEEWVSRNPNRDVLESARVLGKLASAVDYLHSGAVTGNPVLHRDIKPANVIVTAAGAVLVDFGFTRVIGGQPLTIAGTPAYIAPETVTAGEFSPASDRFSLGATGFFALTGETPKLNDRAYMAQKLSEVSGAEGREDIAEHVLSMMDPDPAKRPTGAVPWAQQLAAAAVSDAQMTTISQRTAPLPVTDVMPPPSVEPKDDSKSRRTPLLILGAFVALLVAGAAAFFVLGGGSDDDATAESAAVVTTECNGDHRGGHDYCCHDHHRSDHDHDRRGSSSEIRLDHNH